MTAEKTDPWVLAYRGFEPEQEGLREALTTLGNGRFATRGAAPEAVADDVHYPGTYLAGGYNRLTTELEGEVIENEDLVNLPNWLALTFRVAKGEWFDLAGVELQAYEQRLDLRSGVLERSLRFTDPDGRETKLEERRLVSMSRPDIAALETVITPLNWAGDVEIRSGLDGRVTNDGVPRYRRLASRHLEVLEADEPDDETVRLRVAMNQSRLRVVELARTRIDPGGDQPAARRRGIDNDGFIAQVLGAEASEGRPLRIEKVVALTTSRDRAMSECGLEARKALDRAGDFASLLAEHRRAWEHLWRRFDVDYEHSANGEGERTGQIVHLYLFHLLQTTSPHTMDMDVGVPSRGWHGEAYRGHVFWDELFVFPLLNLRLPEITRSLLMYRYRRLDEARANAARAGYRGAMYPWQSGSDGREESQEIHLNPRSKRWIPDNSNLQRHVNSAIAFNVYHYTQVAHDHDFLSFYGAEMLLEIARFWASIATYNPDLDRYEILGVMGPDEYHDAYPDADAPGLNNNAYTNVMAAWVLHRALEVLDVLPEVRRRELRETLELDDEELDEWRTISRRLRVPFHDDGIISQFEGYEELEELDWEGLAERFGDIQRLDRVLEADDDTPNRYKASKQADVLMLFFLFSAEELERLFDQLGYDFDPETIPKNIAYYLDRTSHGSTLSRVAHSWVLARSDRERSWDLFGDALRSDVDDIQGGTTPEGIHLGAMAGTVDMLTRGYTGLETRDEVLWFNPCLPDELARLHQHIRYRGHALEVTVTHDTLTVCALGGNQPPIKIALGERSFELSAGSEVEIPLTDGGC
ncbi:MAG TPA: glycosyl hydrolase family 65 protein [Methylomirabilota bacterium]|nr:glycosyl hydrolase family 65 protein [Methylomirabilota bacterium]